MADDQQFCLRWNDFQQNMVASFKNLREEQSFCDVTIATEVGFGAVQIFFFGKIGRQFACLEQKWGKHGQGRGRKGCLCESCREG
jgi:hypothetical protein